ncbi:MAG TPA: DNA-formamidopyrimidine glycosylase family protein [Candidatus Dormibacteraeota bacterium]|nr:DNA-formamidopyrimidine glycosylase family protein [Candidatus Dormibacteraeota bacterium]
MPEGDTVHLVAARLQAALAGQRLTRSDLRVPRLATVDLGGRIVDNVAARGKHLLLRIGGPLTLDSHLRMDGAWHLYRPAERWRGGPEWQVRAVLATEAWTAVGYRLPVLELFPSGEEGERLGHLGPDPLAEDWDPAEALRRLTADPERSISAALLDQRVIAGIGNVWRCEICFLRGLDPDAPLRAVGDPAALLGLVKRMFEANRHLGGQVTTGDPRRGRAHYVYGRAGEPCRRCGTPIRRRAMAMGEDGERLTFWCPRCQRND